MEHILKLQVKVKKLNPKATLPTYGTSGSAAMDLTAISETPYMHGSVQYVEYGTGIALSIPAGHVGIIAPRSSVSSNTSMVLSNSIGIIDSDYTGEIKFRYKFLNPPGLNKKYNIGDRIGQIFIIPIPLLSLVEVSELTETDRGDSGYGSTGK